MNEVANLVSALGLFSTFKALDAMKEEKRARQEEEFVPFNLPPLHQEEELTPEPVTTVLLPA